MLKSKRQFTSDIDLSNLLLELEIFVSHLIDAEAMAHAAAETMERIPYLPRHRYRERHIESHAVRDSEVRIALGRMQSYVIATHNAIRALMDEMEQIRSKLNSVTLIVRHK